MMDFDTQTDIRTLTNVYAYEIGAMIGGEVARFESYRLEYEERSRLDPTGPWLSRWRAGAKEWSAHRAASDAIALDWLAAIDSPGGRRLFLLAYRQRVGGAA